MNPQHCKEKVISKFHSQEYTSPGSVKETHSIVLYISNRHFAAKRRQRHFIGIIAKLLACM